MSMVRHIPVRWESDYWSRPYMFPNSMLSSSSGFPPHPPPSYPAMPLSPVWTSSGLNEPTFPLENPSRRWNFQEDSNQMSNINQEMRRMSNEMNRMMQNMRGNLPVPYTVDDWRLSENFRMDNPIREEHDGSRKFYLQFDVRQFKPEEINVKTNGNQLTVQAKHQEDGSGKQVHREYCRQYVIPREVNPEHLISKLSTEGMLTIEAPLPALQGPRDKLIPIEHKK
ncbi:heat shock protein Hsp-16.41-like [Argopecten irradians]|uniref:heat shock protein Hsp-16.41-like n=1 Tax=Argopecten irradians TaxID=31199 RepID=UPI003719BD5D